MVIRVVINRTTLKRFIFLFIGCVFALYLSIIIHEFGHGIPAILKGGGISKIVIFPGYEVYPHFGKKEFFHLIQTGYSESNWPIGYKPNDFDLGLEKFLGSGLTLIISFVSVMLLWLLKPKGFLKFVLMIFSFLFLDILSYSLFPSIGLPNRIFIGEINAEPVEGLKMMGLSKALALSLIIASVILIVILIWRFLKKFPFPKHRMLSE